VDSKRWSSSVNPRGLFAQYIAPIISSCIRMGAPITERYQFRYTSGGKIQGRYLANSTAPASPF